MASLGLNHKKLLEDFTAKAKILLGNNLVSVILYGSLASGGHIKGHSDINLLIVLETVGLEDLQKISAVKSRGKFNSISPLVFSRNYLRASTDTFPIEFLDIKDSHLLLHGEDCVKDLIISPANLRRQCEWELKSKLIQLQRLVINSQGRDKPLEQFMLNEFPSFIVVFKNILRLKNISLSDKEEILDRIKAEFSIPEDILKVLWLRRIGGPKIKNIPEAFRKFLSTLERISDEVDKIPA